jgi:large subunit ribosomal protein L10
MENVGRVLRTRLIDDIKEGIKTRNNTFLISYSEVSAAQFNDLRKDLKRIGADVVVSKNRLAGIALKETSQQLADTIDGQMAFIWSNADAAAVSKLLKEFSGKCKGVKVAGGLLAGAFLSSYDVERLSSLPSREILLSQLLASLNAPLTRFAGILNAKSQDLLSILKQLSEKKGGS